MANNGHTRPQQAAKEKLGLTAKCSTCAVHALHTQFRMPASLSGMMKENDKLIPLPAMAHRLRVPAKWLRTEAEGGRVPHLRADRVLLFDPETVQRVLLKRARMTGKETAS